MVKTIDYTGKNRRKLTVRDILALISIVGILGGAVLWVGKLQWNQRAMAESISKKEAKDSKQDKDIVSIKTDVAVIRTEQQILKTDVKTIKEDTKKNGELLFEIKGLLKGRNTSRSYHPSYAGDRPNIGE